MKYHEAVLLERVARELKSLIGYGAKPEHVISRQTLVELVSARHPETEISDLGALIVHYIEEARDLLPEIEAEAVTRLLKLKNTTLNAKARREAVTILLKEYCSEQVWRKCRELGFMRKVARAFLGALEVKEPA